MNLFGQDGPDDFVGAGIDGIRQGYVIGKLAYLLFAGIFLVLFCVLRFLTPLIIKFLAWFTPILWRALGELWGAGTRAIVAGFSTLKRWWTNRQKASA